MPNQLHPDLPILTGAGLARWFDGQALRTLCERQRTGSDGYCRDHLRALAQRIEVDEKEVRIMGSKSALLRTLVIASSANRLRLECPVLYRNGAPEGIRTPDPQIRSLVLYPAELPAP